MDFKIWLEGQTEKIFNLQPSTVLTVFHGTSQDDAYNFCLNGVDAKKYQQYRIYTHISGGKPIKFGLFVAPNLKTAQKFGNVVIKFKSLGKNLIYRFPVEMGKENKGYWKEKYPKSFRPSVSQDLLDYRGVEPQSIYIGLLSPRAIEKVYVYMYDNYTWKPMTREEYIEEYQKKNPNPRVWQSLFEPQEYKLELKDVVARIAKDQKSSEEEILQILKNIYKRNGYLTGIGNIPYSLLRRIESQIRNLVKKDNPF